MSTPTEVFYIIESLVCEGEEITLPQFAQFIPIDKKSGQIHLAEPDNPFSDFLADYFEGNHTIALDAIQYSIMLCVDGEYIKQSFHHDFKPGTVIDDLLCITTTRPNLFTTRSFADLFKNDSINGKGTQFLS